MSTGTVGCQERKRVLVLDLAICSWYTLLFDLLKNTIGDVMERRLLRKRNCKLCAIIAVCITKRFRIPMSYAAKRHSSASMLNVKTAFIQSKFKPLSCLMGMKQIYIEKIQPLLRLSDGGQIQERCIFLWSVIFR